MSAFVNSDPKETPKNINFTTKPSNTTETNSTTDNSRTETGDTTENSSCSNSNDSKESSDSDIKQKDTNVPFRINPNNASSSSPGSSNTSNNNKQDAPITMQSIIKINALTKPSEPCGNKGQDNINGDLIVRLQDILLDETKGRQRMDEYHVNGSLGEGAYGVVCRCAKRRAKNTRIQDVTTENNTSTTTTTATSFNSTSNIALSTSIPLKEYAVKVIKNRPAYYNAALNEVRVLQVIQARLGTKCRSIITLETSFVHQKHLCLVFEVLGINLYEMLMQNQFRGLPMELLRTILTQLLEATSQLHSLQIIHCDLKPENILLRRSGNPLKDDPNNQNNTNGRDSTSCDIKVIDLGSACFDGQTIYPYIQSRFYRAPEVVLGVSYDNAIDMWSIGCIAAELFVGLPLFPGVSEHAQLARIMDMFQDYPPLWMLHQGTSTLKMFTKKEIKVETTSTTAVPLLSSLNISEHTPTSPRSLLRTDSIASNGSGNGIGGMGGLGGLGLNGKNNSRNGINPLTGGVPKTSKHRWSTLKRPPSHVRQRGAKCGERSHHPYVFKTPEEYSRDNQRKNTDEYKTYFRYTSLEDIIMYYTMPKDANAAEILRTRTKRCALVDLLRRLLRVDPTERMTAHQALAHPFLTGKLDTIQPGISTLDEVVKVLSVWEPPKDLTRIMRRRSHQKRVDACEREVFGDVPLLSSMEKAAFIISSTKEKDEDDSGDVNEKDGKDNNRNTNSNQQQKGSYKKSAPRRISTNGKSNGSPLSPYNTNPPISSSLPNYMSTSPMAGMAHVLSGQW